MESMRPLEGIKVLDFGTLLPGPLATLILAEAGADVIKIERPGRGDEMRSYVPEFGADSINFAMLNRGKRSIAIDLKAPDALDRLTPIIRDADIVLEQFRPGVLDRLGFSYATLAAINPGLIYTSITGYGQNGDGPEAAAHDLNLCARTGLLHLAAGRDGVPTLPAALVADIAGGTYPAVINILLALRQRDKTGLGCWLDIAMADNVFPFLYWAMGDGLVAGQWPRPGAALITGGSPRYNVYRTADDRFIAAAPMETKFWETFCRLISLVVPDDTAQGNADGYAVQDAENDILREQVAAIIATRTAAAWQAHFDGHDVCCTVVATIEEALHDPHFRARGLFDWTLTDGDKSITALPVPVASQFRAHPQSTGYPALGDANDLLAVKPQI
jgi:alpha-methylacyl-CoA racemase